MGTDYLNCICGAICVFAVLVITEINVVFAYLPVNVNGKLIEGGNPTFSCTPDGTLRRMTWSKTGPDEMAPNSEFILRHGVGDALLYGPDVDSTHYEFDEASNVMTVLNLTIDDDGRYWCQAKTAEYVDAVNSTLASIIVPPDASTTTITYNDTSYKHGDKMEVGAGEQTFICTTTGVKPAATFMWKPDTLSEKTTSEENKKDSRLFDSSSNATIEIMSPLSPTQLTCATSNDGSMGVEITVTLKLKEQVNPTETSNGGLSPGATAGLVIGVVVAFGIMIAMGAGAYHYNKRQS